MTGSPSKPWQSRVGVGLYHGRVKSLQVKGRGEGVEETEIQSWSDRIRDTGRRQ